MARPLHAILATSKRFTWGGCVVCSLACLLSTELLAAERADPPLSLRLQSCNRELLLLLLLTFALQNGNKQRLLMFVARSSP